MNLPLRAALLRAAIDAFIESARRLIVADAFGVWRGRESMAFGISKTRVETGKASRRDRS